MKMGALKISSTGVYIVYMGGSNGTPRRDHAQLVSSLIKRNETILLHSYSSGFYGFAAHLSEDDARSISHSPGVVSVFPDTILQLQTTRSWDFLSGLATGYGQSSPPYSPPMTGSDTIIGFLDSGIWPEAQSFNDQGIGPIPSHWNGTCMEGHDFTISNCNRKVIGARFYDDPQFAFGTPRDDMGHGTHVASTAAGQIIQNSAYYGLAEGTSHGGSPSSRIAMYRVCSRGKGCFGSAILKAFDDAIFDGVDIISVSLGGDPTDFIYDPIAIGSFHAVEKGIIVVCAAGNKGPSPATVANIAPWIFTVSATTIDRDMEACVFLGGNIMIRGGGINFSNLQCEPVYPLIDGNSAKLNSYKHTEADARNCAPGSLDDNLVLGKIVVCENNPNDAPLVKFGALKDQGAIGMILIDNNRRRTPENYHTSPIVAITEEDGAAILSYIKTNSNPVATILPTGSIPLNYEPAPVVAGFSSRGPIVGIPNLLKPDVAAPGVAILAAWPSPDASIALPGSGPPLFNIISGTSMACPHVSGLAAVIKSQHPTWSPSAIRSSIMTTAISTNNMQGPITTETGARAGPYEIGSGVINLHESLQPGLVYETEPKDYIEFLCSLGYSTQMIRVVAPDVGLGFICSQKDMNWVSDLNYPSIAVSGIKLNETKTVIRTVTNVGEEVSTYRVLVEAPVGVDVIVVPNVLIFRKGVKRLRFQVLITKQVSDFFPHDSFGFITWSGARYKVRSPLVISSRARL